MTTEATDVYYNEHEGELEDIEFSDNPEPRCPCVLLLDVSGSMRGDKIQSVNQGIRTLKEIAMRDSLTSRRAELAVVTFNHSSRIAQDFVTINDFEPKELRAGGGTSMVGPIRTVIDMLSERKRTYRQHGISYFRPICVMITDGYPHNDAPDDLSRIADEIRDQEDGRHLAFFTFAVDGSDMNLLERIAPPNRPPKPLPEAQIEDIFTWLSTSVSMISQSQPGDRLSLPQVEDYVDY